MVPMVKMVQMVKTEKVQHLQLEIMEISLSMEKIRERETEKAIAKLSDVDANAKIIDNLTNSIVNKIFFDISKKIKQAAHENDEELIRAIEFMFEEK